MKKEYIQPNAEIVNIKLQGMIAVSVKEKGVSVTGEDAMSSRGDWNCNDWIDDEEE